LKILAIEHEFPNASEEAFHRLAKAEASRVWELYQQGVIRELYFRADRSEAVLMLECPDVASAQEVLRTLPLVSNKLIEFEIIPLKAYPGFARLFGDAQ
jgi:muconolactone delta-isomerase